MGNSLANREGEDMVNLILFRIVAFIEKKQHLEGWRPSFQSGDHICASIWNAE